ncbi:MAG: hypothetical protein J6Y77_06740 [Paludibacteraceae bacterium]|nr:hypothetical protein [Paludibacteraceae bacterium]
MATTLTSRSIIPAPVLTMLTMALMLLFWLPAYWGTPTPAHLPLDWQSYWYALLHTVWSPTDWLATTLSWLIPLILGICVFFINRRQQFIRTESLFPIFYTVFVVGLIGQAHSMCPGMYAMSFVGAALLRFVDNPDDVWCAFDVHFFLAAGSLFSFEVIWYAPLFFLFLVIQRHFNIRMMWSSLFGILIPYAITIGIALFTDTLPLFGQMMLNVWHSFGWYPITDGSVWAQFSMILVMSLWTGLSFLRYYNNDKTRARNFISFVYALLVFSMTISFFYPAPLQQGGQVISLFAAIAFAHYFANARGRVPKIVFTVSVLAMTAIYTVHYLL